MFYFKTIIFKELEIAALELNNINGSGRWMHNFAILIKHIA